MKKTTTLLFAYIIFFCTHAQDESKSFDYPLVVTVHFPALGVPFRNLALNFRNIGVGVGTEITLNSARTWVQQLHIAWLRNRNAGNQLHLNTQTAWRPGIGTDAFGEIKAGVGYAYLFTPSAALTSTSNGWHTSGHRGKGMLAFPVGAALGSQFYDGPRRYAPFIGYQLLLLTKYNATIPLMPMSIIQTGISIAK